MLLITETQYKKEDFETLNMQGLNLFGVPIDASVEDSESALKAGSSEVKKALRDLIDLTE